MEARKSEGGWRGVRGFTLVELLVVLAIVSLLVALLLPSLSRSKAAAVASVDGNQQKSILSAAFVYVADNKGFTPVARTQNFGDFTVGGSTDTAGINTASLKANPKLPCYGPAGADLWALVQVTAASVMYSKTYSGNPPTTATGVNDYHNWGVLIGQQYAPIGVFFTPSAKIDTSGGSPTFWGRRQYFGDVYANPWNKDGTNWTPYYGGSNYYFQGSYIYRGADWQVSSFDATTGLVNGNTVGFKNVQLKNLRVETPGFNKKTLMMSMSPTQLAPILGANVGWADGHVSFFVNDNYIAGRYNREPSPYINQVGTSSYGGWRTLPLNAAETFQ